MTAVFICGNTFASLLHNLLQPVSKICACKYTTVKMNQLPQTLLSKTRNGTEIIIVN